MGPENVAKGWCCGPELSRWAAGGSPTQGHCGPHPLCSQVLSQEAGSTLSWGGQDHPDGQILGQLHPLVEEEEGAGAAPPAGPACPEMGSEELRLASFYAWPPTAVVRPELLAAAGFFHTGESGGPGGHSGPFWTGARAPSREGPGLMKMGGGSTALHVHPQPWSLLGTCSIP